MYGTFQNYYLHDPISSLRRPGRWTSYSHLADEETEAQPGEGYKARRGGAARSAQSFHPSTASG